MFMPFFLIFVLVLLFPPIKSPKVLSKRIFKYLCHILCYKLVNWWTIVWQLWHFSHSDGFITTQSQPGQCQPTQYWTLGGDQNEMRTNLTILKNTVLIFFWNADTTVHGLMKVFQTTVHGLMKFFQNFLLWNFLLESLPYGHWD